MDSRSHRHRLVAALDAGPAELVLCEGPSAGPDQGGQEALVAELA